MNAESRFRVRLRFRVRKLRGLAPASRESQHPAMRVVKTVSAMQRLALEWRRESRRVALVPTMGYLHAGHVSLIERARKLVGPKGLVIVSIYVNPTQFAPTEDLSRYPRDFARDRKLCQAATVDAIFCPTDDEMYPGKSEGHYSTYVIEENLSRSMEGASRPTHFRGVTTVCAKLFNIVLPAFAVFGAKDFQQAAIMQRMVRDLNFPMRIVVAPTIRERDGLAMSSRNRYLNAEERRQAVALSQAISHARAAVTGGSKPAVQLKSTIEKFIARQPLAKLDYIEFFSPADFRPASRVERGTHMALAVFFGKTRLIDNGRL
jgi:pantoate--beta-alanine ligase